jgi:multiple antibiotic resistance protein
MKLFIQERVRPQTGSPLEAPPMQTLINTFLVVLAAIFPVVNPPGSALVFLGLTSTWTPDIRRALARRVAFNSLLVLVCSFLLGALILQFYGISIPVLRVAGGFVVAVAGWKLLNEGSHKDIEASPNSTPFGDPLSQAFYPLTLPLTTGPGTIAVVISIGISKATFTEPADELLFIFGSLAAVAVIASAILLCFSYADRIRRILGQGGTDIAVRLSAFILFCLGVQILWSGVSELLIAVLHHGSIPSASEADGLSSGAQALGRQQDDVQGTAGGTSQTRY